MARISSVIVRRFKRIAEIEVPLEEVTLLIGENNSGKSSVLQAIHFAVSVAQTADLVGEGISWRNDKFELSYNPAQLLYSPVGDVLSLSTNAVLTEDKLTQIEIEFRDVEANVCIVGLRRGRNRNLAVSISGRTIGEQLMNLESPFTVYAPGLAGVPKEERYMSPGVVRRIVARGDANLALRNVIRMLTDDDSTFDRFLSDMRFIFPGIDVDIEWEPATDEHINIFFQFPGGSRLPMDAAGTSVLQASQILAYIHLFSPQVLILDEPDSHLHPDNQRLLCDLVFKVAKERDFQALISTHSRHVLNSVTGRGRTIWLNKGAKVDSPDANTTSVLLDLGALDSIDYFADGETRCVIATEDSATDGLRALLLSNGFVDDDIEIASYSGCTKLDSALVLGGFLSDKAPHVKLIVHRDRDYMGDAETQRFDQRLTAAQIYPFVTDGSDVESYFINAAHLHSLNPAASQERIQQLIDQATLEMASKSVEAIINQRTTQAFKDRQNGVQVNHGAISTQANADYAASPTLMRRGKPVLGRLTALLQQEIQANPRIYEPTEFLKLPRLQAIAGAIWPPQH
ncbi:AAA family ATPase [Bradyrhizobium sp. SZCCHNR1051]|uniref:AAA family ATPase n=1 Tax=Bradyrhizobium sp. SZCCHNR1051 TaxID=3057355 RepID=UPI00291603B3|nr:AAA family ATPase [Bradyrhizobium sp. SZCCHNR1051]